MKKTVVMIMAGIMLVAMVACGKDAGANQPQSDQTVDEALEMLNAEINAMMEAEQRQAEEREQRAQQAAEEYPEGVLPEGDYWCYEVQDVYKNGDDQSPLYYTPIELEIYSDDVYLKYEYDAETKEYIIVRRYSPYLPNKFADWDHIFIGYLDEEGNLIVTHYERINYAYSGNWQEVVLDDIEWVYVRESADNVSDNISDNIEPTDVSEVAIQDLIVTLTQGVYECTDDEGYSLEIIDLINNKEYFYKMNGDGTNLLLFYNPNSSNSWCFHIEGDLVENNLVINYFVRYDAEKLYEVLRTVAVPDMIQRFEEEYPDVADLILDDIEWVYVLQED